MHKLLWQCIVETFHTKQCHPHVPPEEKDRVTRVNLSCSQKTMIVCTSVTFAAIHEIVRYFNLDQSGGQTDQPTDTAIPGATLLAWLKIQNQSRLFYPLLYPCTIRYIFNSFILLCCYLYGFKTCFTGLVISFFAYYSLYSMNICQ